jgi:hypothetical protein
MWQLSHFSSVAFYAKLSSYPPCLDEVYTLRLQDGNFTEIIIQAINTWFEVSENEIRGKRK